jgi:hypothetical protein
LADPSSQFFAQQNSVDNGGKKVMQRKENAKPRKHRTKQKKKKAETKGVSERQK